MNTQNLPPLLPREQMLAILHSQVYGHLPPRPEQLSFTREVLGAPTFGGKAECTRVTAHFTLHGKPFSFPFHATIPTAPGRHPFFVHVNFRPAEVGKTFFDGHIAYHLRGGDHFFSREDWQKLIRFVNHHR